jgi:hypothetical protein
VPALKFDACKTTDGALDPVTVTPVGTPFVTVPVRLIVTSKYCTAPVPTCTGTRAATIVPDAAEIDALCAETTV